MDVSCTEESSGTSKDSLMNSLRAEWNSLFNPEIVRPVRGDSQVQATVMLLETAIFNIKRFELEVVGLQTKNKKVVEELSDAKKECILLKNEIRSLKSTPCTNCSILMRKISQQREEILETKKRIQSIASILNIGETVTNPETQSALELMNEMLVTPDEPKKSSPKKKKANEDFLPKSSSSNLSPSSSSTNGIIVADTAIVDDDVFRLRISPRRNIIIPETQDISPNKNRNVDGNSLPQLKTDVAVGHMENPLSTNSVLRTPKKDESKKRTDDKSPILDHSAKRKKGLSMRSRNENKGLLKNLSQESTVISDSNSLERSTPNLRSHKQLSSPHCIEKISPNVSPKKKISPKKTKQSNKWALKPSNYLDSDVSLTKADKKLKQTTLLLKPVEVKKDITKLKSFNGGIHSASSENITNDELAALQSDDDIILTSPGKNVKPSCSSVLSANTKQNSGVLKVPVVELDTMEETLFNPLAASTCKMDSSFDRVPRIRRQSPNYKYQRDAVKKKSERMQLEGWECDKCAKYYETACKNMNPADIKKQLNRCSRHRNKYPVRTNTPPGFWDPDFSSSNDDEEANFDNK